MSRPVARSHRVRTRRVVDGHLQAVGGRLAAGAGQAHPVRAGALDPDGVEAGDHVGVRIGRPCDLVQQLGGHRAHRDQAAGSRVLGHHGAAVGRHLGDREPGWPGIRQLAQEGVVAAGRLGPALQDVAGDHRPGQPVPVVGRPAEVQLRPDDRDARSPARRRPRRPGLHAAPIPQPQVGVAVTGGTPASPAAPGRLGSGSPSACARRGGRQGVTLDVGPLTRPSFRPGRALFGQPGGLSRRRCHPLTPGRGRRGLSAGQELVAYPLAGSASRAPGIPGQLGQSRRQHVDRPPPALPGGAAGSP